MATLIFRVGDPQALKVAAAAKLPGANNPLTITPVAESRKLAPDTIPPYGSSDLSLLLGDGSVLKEPNAMARYMAPPTPVDITTESWLEWEATSLRPAVYSGDEGSLGRVLHRLEASLTKTLGEGAGLFWGNCDETSIGLADCVIAPTLRAAHLLGRTLTPNIEKYLEAVFKVPSFAAALEQIQMGKLDSSGDYLAAAAVAADASAAQSALPKLPIPGQRNILITSALPYVNNVPHLGNIIGCVLSADVYARFCRARGHNCIYICGTDEYGTATETKALEEGLTCQEICDKYHAIHKEIYEWFGISFDKFGRTPTRAQTAIGQEMFSQLNSNGYLTEQSMEQLYSEPLQKFLADRYVVGTCPKCRYEDARGDQCDSCGSLLNPTELIDPKCKLTGTTPVVKQTRHIFLDLPALSEKLQAYIDATSTSGGWSSNCVQVTKAWMEQGLKIRCITRDLKWGTPVPMPGYEEKVFYVWFDAPIGYVSITAAYCGDAWRAWWLPAEYYAREYGEDGCNSPDVELVQFMGKDNVPFHTVIFPASQLGTHRPWTMMRSISVTEYLNYEDGKFSKSRGIGVFGNDAKSTGIPVEMWRYYLLAVRPETSDSAFQWDDFAAKINADLNDNLGNFINRTLKFVDARFDGTVPGVVVNLSVDSKNAIDNLGEKVSDLVGQYIKALEAQRIKLALQLVLSVSRAGNGFFQETEIWRVVKEDRGTAGAYISACMGIVAILAALLQPYMPTFTQSLLKQMGMEEAQVLGLDDGLVERTKRLVDLVPAGHTIGKEEPKPLFRKITDAEVEDLRCRFAGSQDERKDSANAAANVTTSVNSKKENGTAKKKENRKDEQKKKDGAQVLTGGKQEKNSVKVSAAGSGDKEKASVDISRIDLRVGHIRKAWKHPDAESLYVEEVDVGEGEPRTVVSGLVKYIPEAEMQDRMVVLVCNLKPANMRGIRSQAMVLAATSADGEKVELVQPPAGSKVGERVFVEGFLGEPDEVLNSKKKVWETVQPELMTDGDCQACWKGSPLRTALGVCTVQTISGGSIK